MLEVLVAVPATAMTAAAAWHLPAFPHTDLRHRALWGCYAGAAGSLWLQLPSFDHLVDLGPITEGSILLRAYIAIGSLLALAIYMATGSASYRGRRPVATTAVARWTARFGPWAALVTATVMTGVFFAAVGRGARQGDFALAHIGEPGAALFLTPYYTFAAAVNIVCFLQWVTLLRRADTLPLRAGLATMSTAMLLGLLYGTTRLMWLWAAVASPNPPGTDRRISHVTGYLEIAMSVTFAAGVALPPAGEIAARVSAWRTIREIYPLWAGLTRAVPQTAGCPEPLWRALFRTSPPVTARLDLMTQEVGDICEQLRHYAPKGLLAAAEDATVGHEDPDAAAEAAWINAALVAVAQEDRHNTASSPLPTKPISTSSGEAAWLRRVERIFVTLTAQDGQALLEESRQAA